MSRVVDLRDLPATARREAMAIDLSVAAGRVDEPTLHWLGMQVGLTYPYAQSATWELERRAKLDT